MKQCWIILVTWQYNGSKTTIDEFRKLDTEGKMGVIDFIKELLIYEEISVGDKELSFSSCRFRKLFSHKMT